MKKKTPPSRSPLQGWASLAMAPLLALGLLAPACADDPEPPQAPPNDMNNTPPQPNNSSTQDMLGPQPGPLDMNFVAPQPPPQPGPNDLGNAADAAPDADMAPPPQPPPGDMGKTDAGDAG